MKVYIFFHRLADWNALMLIAIRLFLWAHGLLFVCRDFNYNLIANDLIFLLKQKQKPLLIVAEDLESEVLGTLIINRLRGGIKVGSVSLYAFIGWLSQYAFVGWTFFSFSDLT